MDEFTTVTLDELRTRLPDLLRRVADGEELVVMDGDRAVATLTPPPDEFATLEEIAEAQVKVKEAIRKWVQLGIDQGLPPRPGSPLEELIREVS